MRVGLIMERADTLGATGIGRYGFELARNLCELPGVEEVHVLYYKALQAAPFHEHPRLQLHHLPRLRNFLVKLVVGSVSLGRTYSRLRLDIVHDTNQMGPFLVARSGGPLRVMTVHDLTPILFPEHHSRYRAVAHRLFLKPTAERADLVLTDSDSTKRDLEAFLGRRRVSAQRVHLGVSPDFSPGPPDPAILGKYGLKPGYVLYVGTLEPRKSVATLVRAYAHARVKGTASPLVLVGRRGWGYESIFEEIRRLDLSPHVSFLDYVAREHLPDLYRAAGCFVYPSLYEGFGLPPLEAMACGTPVVASGTSSIPEVVGDAGILVDPRDEPAIGDAIVALLSDAPRAADLRARATARAAGFTWRRCAEQTLDLYRTLLDAEKATAARSRRPAQSPRS